MPRILFIGAHRRDRSPSQRYRFDQFIPYWERHGFDVHYASLIDEADDAVFYTPGNLLAKGRIFLKSFHLRREHVRMAAWFDLVFVQREAFMTGSTRFERALARSGPPVIYDFDDAIWHMDVSDGNRHLRWLKDPGKTATLIRLAHHVIAGNEHLAEYARGHNGSVEVIPTVIDTERYVPRTHGPQRGPVVIGWTGSRTSMAHLRKAAPVLQELAQRWGDRIRFRVVSDQPFTLPGLPVENVPWRHSSEPEDLAPMDVGIMPLRDDPWSRGKCGLKGLQYMAMGIPPVMSPVGVNSSIVRDGENGFLAADPAEWTAKLGLLIQDADLRARLGQEARRTVEQQYSTVAWRDHYVQLFNHLIRTHGDRNRTEVHRAAAPA